MNTTRTNHSVRPEGTEARTMRAVVQTRYGSDPDEVLAVGPAARPDRRL